MGSVWRGKWEGLLPKTIEGTTCQGCVKFRTCHILEEIIDLARQGVEVHINNCSKKVTGLNGHQVNA